MNNLELIDPASPEKTDFYLLMSNISLGSFLLSSTILIVTVCCLLAFANTRSTQPRRFKVTLAAGIILTGAFVAATFMSNNQADRIYEERKVNAAKNVVAVQEWAEDIYGVDLNEKQARDMIRAKGESAGVTPSKYENSGELTELGGSLIYDVNDEVTKAQLVYDGERYLLIRDSGGELERR